MDYRIQVRILIIHLFMMSEEKDYFLYITENELLAAYEKDFSRDLGHWRERENV